MSRPVRLEGQLPAAAVLRTTPSRGGICRSAVCADDPSRPRGISTRQRPRPPPRGISTWQPRRSLPEPTLSVDLSARARVPSPARRPAQAAPAAPPRPVSTEYPRGSRGGAATRTRTIRVLPRPVARRNSETGVASSILDAGARCVGPAAYLPQRRHLNRWPVVQTPSAMSARAERQATHVIVGCFAGSRPTPHSQQRPVRTAPSTSAMVAAAFGPGRCFALGGSLRAQARISVVRAVLTVVRRSVYARRRHQRGCVSFRRVALG